MEMYHLDKLRLKLVIVEASEHLRTMLSVMVKPIKGEIYLADHAEAGFELARLVKPDLIIADYGLDGSGAAFCARVRQDAELKTTPFVMLSAFGGHLNLTTYRASGCNQLLYKPFRCMDLYAAISEALAGNTRRAPHLVPVMYRNGEFDLVDARFLDELITLGEIECFRRRNGQVVIGRDPIRREDLAGYAGAERRCLAD